MTEDGWALYQFERDTARKSRCTDACAKTWIPFAAPEITGERGDWTTIRRDDGSKQWLYQGKPLYRYALELRPRETSASAIHEWTPAFVQVAPAPPPEISVRMTSLGEVYVDKSGMTLYTFYCNEEAPDGLGCDGPGTSQVYRLSACGGPEKCMATYRPVVAAADAKSDNLMWSVTEINPRTGALCAAEEECGLRVWAHNGKPIYTYAGDKRPGDYHGHFRMTWPFYTYNALQPGRLSLF
jgi:predicted lipoprotein with Yx(FWY)xxD motif